jgi:peptide/nickel transport system substrate-binding protein
MSPSPEDIRSLVTDYTGNKIGRRQFLSRAMALGLSGSAAGVLLSACGGSSKPGTSGGAATTVKPPTTALTYRPEQDIENLDPAFWVSQDDAIVFNCIYEGLVTFRPGTWQVVNQLAESFEASADGLQFHFTLKQGIEWQKGYGEVRASDVKFSYERIAGLTKPSLNSPYSGDWSALDSVQVTGPYEGTIILKQPFAPLMHSTLPASSGLVIPEKAVAALGKNFATNPVGSGPFEFVSWVPGQHTTLKRFDSYSGANKAFAAKTPWTTIETDVIGSDNTAFEAISSGSVAFGYIPPSLVGQAESSGSLKVYSRPTLNYYFLSISQKNVPNLNLRRAIRAAIDVPGIIKAAYNGKYERAYGIIPPSMGIGYWAGAPHYNQDLTLAKQYLNQSGESNVSLTLAVANDTPDESAAQVIAANLAQIGIKVNIQPEDAATISDIPGPGGGGPHRQLVYSDFVSEPDPYWSFIWFTCAQIGLWNWSDWCDAGFTSLLNKALGTYDVAQRDQLYTQASRLWDAQANIVWVAYPTWYFAAQPWAQPSLRPDGYPYLWNTTAT